MAAWLFNFFFRPESLSLQYLNRNTPLDSPEYTRVVTDIIPFLDLFTVTFVFSLQGTAASFPFLFSPSNVKWVKEVFTGARMTVLRDTTSLRRPSKSANATETGTEQNGTEKNGMESEGAAKI